MTPFQMLVSKKGVQLSLGYIICVSADFFSKSDQKKRKEKGFYPSLFRSSLESLQKHK